MVQILDIRPTNSFLMKIGTSSGIMTATQSHSQPCQYTITIKGHSRKDHESGSLYATASAVSLLPIRRVKSHGSGLRETIITLDKLRPLPGSALLRIKGICLDFSSDLVAGNDIVPGMKAVGTITLNTEQETGSPSMQRGQRVFLFPYSTCLIQNSRITCKNCSYVASVLALLANDKDALYELYRDHPCLGAWVYGKTLDGGLQDFIRVPAPLKLLVVPPKLVSLHDCCLLLDTAVPFLAYCKDYLCKLNTPRGKVVVILNDSRKEANDCLLVLRHLVLNDELFTFTDMNILTTTPEIRKSYANLFQHVFLLNSSQEALDVASSFRFSSFNSIGSSITIFETFEQRLPKIPESLRVARMKMSYKDKILMEYLLETLNDMNSEVSQCSVEPIGWSPDLTLEASLHSLKLVSRNSHDGEMRLAPLDTSANFANSIGSPISQADSWEDSKKDNFDHGRMHPRWLHCDYTFHLRPNDSCEHEHKCRCVLTSIINQLRSQAFAVKRVYLKNYPAQKSALNAFVFC